VPIYEYACQKCGHAFDALQKVSDGPLRKCPECGAMRLKRLVSAPQFRLKGTGWYETDFKTDKDRKKRLADGAEASPAADTAATDAGKDGDSAKAAPAPKAGEAGAGKADKPAKATPARAKKSPGGKAAAAD